MTVGYIFAGQGQQFVSMGEDLVALYPSAARTYAQASQILGYDVLKLDESQLSETRFTQPALYVLHTVIAQLLETNNISANVVCGLSLGEYNAITEAGVIDFETGLALIQKRAEIMHNALTPYTSGMAACLKTDRHTVEAVLQGHDVAICNVNTPSQIVIGGNVEALEAVIPALKEAGVRMVIPLKVSTVSHMALLKPASALLRGVLESVPFRTPKISFINNIHAQVQSDNFVDTLARHISEPTELAASIQKMVDMGVDTIIEIGPKGSISKFVKEICGDTVKTYNVYSAETLGGLIDDQ
ncbi:acyltransferase domain-containing protein [Erysipelothrix sp. HDW6B]|uniref:ACP S-malonyltransferase n=1 Tax=Erysipelothrix TaxID=1647 RepID=UPI001357B76E|nr:MULTISPECIES: acyltransferase domain-containing protein [Erysipelothrix]QIK85667.1 acyltransferase domain-containing protein [Erysipelothrix sp. HDW6B]